MLQDDDATLHLSFFPSSRLDTHKPPSVSALYHHSGLFVTRGLARIPQLHFSFLISPHFCIFLYNLSSRYLFFCYRDVAEHNITKHMNFTSYPNCVFLVFTILLARSLSICTFFYAYHLVTTEHMDFSHLSSF